jgi:CubicO group peptidase (beta-lactamase class C family)
MSSLDGPGTAFARIDEVVERALEGGQVPGVVAAVARGEIVHVATAGVMAVGGAPMRRDTLFRLSSTTKPMTAAAVLSLVDDGLLELNGPVDELLPELAARAAGAPFDVVLHERVFGPLGMKDTAFHVADTSRLSTAYENRDGLLVVSDPPDGQWSRPPLFPDGGGGLVSSADDVVAFGRMLMRGGSPVLKPATVAEMTRDQLTAGQRANIWPGFSFLGDRGWGFGLSVLGDGRYTWEGGFGTAWSNVPSQDLTVVVLTQRAVDETGMPAVCDDVLSAARGTNEHAR